jgi:hypothetical protein
MSTGVPQVEHRIESDFASPGEKVTVFVTALGEFGAQLEGIRPEDFIDRSSVFRFDREPRGFDVLPAILGID